MTDQSHCASEPLKCDDAPSARELLDEADYGLAQVVHLMDTLHTITWQERGLPQPVHTMIVVAKEKAEEALSRFEQADAAVRKRLAAQRAAE